MALFTIVNVIGLTAYFVFFVLLLWLSRIPRSSRASLWWATAIALNFAARLSLALLDQPLPSPLAESAYGSLIMVEKFFFIGGLLVLLRAEKYLPGVAGVLALALLLLLGIRLVDGLPWLYSLCLSLINSALLFGCAWLVVSNRQQLPTRALMFSALLFSLLALHWLSYPLVQIFPQWPVSGLLLGTGLTLAIYLSLVTAVLSIFQNRLLEAERKALDMAYHDPLTGLNNQRYMNNLFEQALLLANRPHQMLAVIYIDLDNFKPINDSAGHQVGDLVLKEVARRIKSVTRSTDICARIGGDEFVVIATQLELPAHIEIIAQKLLDCLCAPIAVNQQEYVLGASIGISQYPLQGSSLQQLLEAADSAMYAVKKSGKCGFKLAS